MAKLTLATIDSEYASVTTLNANFDAIEAALENTLSRDGTTPNAMNAALDMNNYSIINIADLNGVPASDLADLGSFVAQAEQAATNASVSETNASSHASAASTSASNAAASAASAAAVIADIDAVNGIVKGDGAGNYTAAAANTDYLAPASIGVTVQGYDVDTAKLDVEQTWTQVQRTNELTDNDGSFDLDAGYLDFKCTPSAGVTLTFTNIPATTLVQKGTIVLVNGSNYAIAAHVNTKISAADLTKISSTGTYLLSYRTSAGVVYVVSSASLA